MPPMPPTPPTPPTIRGSILIALAGVLVLAGVLTYVLRPALVTRRVEWSLDLQAAGPAWEVLYTPADARHPANGYWMDPAEHGVSEAGSLFTTLEPMVFTRPLPTRAVRWVSLRWHDQPAGAAYRVNGLSVRTRLFGSVVHTEHMAPPPGGAPWMPAAGDGRADFDVSPVRGVYTLAVFGVAFAASAAGLGVLGLLMVAAGWWDRLLERLPVLPLTPRRTRVLTIASVALVVGVPAYLAWWSPVTLFSDSTAYIWLAKLLWETRDISHFDGWRMPGYAVFIAPWVAKSVDYPFWVGVSQGVLGVLGALAAFDIVRRRGLRAPWPQVAMLMVALNPMMMVWQRVMLSECLGAFFVMAGAWGFTVLEPRLRRDDPASRRWLYLGFAGLGVLAGAASLTRGNLQLLPLAFAGGAVLTGLLAGAGAARRAVLAVMVMGVVFVLILLPVLLHNHRTFDRRSLVVGASAGRTVFAWQNTDIDFNQTAAFSLEEYRDLRERVGRGEVSEWGFCAMMQRNERISVPEGSHPWVVRDLRSGFVLKESVARMPDRYAYRLMTAAMAHLGFWVDHPWYFSRLAQEMLGIYRGSHVTIKTTLYDDVNRFPEYIRPTLERAVRDISAVPDSLHSRAYRHWWSVWREARPVLSVLLILGAVRSLVRRDVTALMLAGLVFANIAGVVVVQFSGETRYTMTFQGLADVAMILGLFGRSTEREA